VLDLQGLFKSAAIAWLSGADERYGYCNMREMSHLVSTPICGEHQNGHIVERYLDVARALGCTVEQGLFSITITEQEAAAARQSMKQAGITESTRFVALAPGTNWPTKCWPTRSYAELADQLAAAGSTTAILGGPGDRKLAGEITAAAKSPVVDLVGKTSLKQLAYVIKQARAFVGGDTGPMHLAVAVGTPVVALFGPTDPVRNGPYSGENTVLTAAVECCGCWQRKCDKNIECMTSITVDEVLEAVKRTTSK
jgi:heptosyltransferase-1